jgi:hypothetical protein
MPLQRGNGLCDLPRASLALAVFMAPKAAHAAQLQVRNFGNNPGILKRCARVLPRLAFLPGSRTGAWRLLRRPGWRPGPGFEGFGTLVRRGRFAWRFGKDQRTRAGVSRPGLTGASQGRRRSGEGSGGGQLGEGGDDQPGPAVGGRPLQPARRRDTAPRGDDRGAQPATTCSPAVFGCAVRSFGFAR